MRSAALVPQSGPFTARWSKDLLSSYKTRIIQRRALALIGGLLAIGLSPAGHAEPTKLDLTAYRGKVVYVDFWASWCGPCKLSFPYMAGLTRQYSGRDFALVTVNLDKSRGQADAFLRQMGTSLPVIYDSSGNIAAQYHVSDMPTAMLIDRSGHVRFVHKGFRPAQTALYRQHIDQLLSER